MRRKYCLLAGDLPRDMQTVRTVGQSRDVHEDCTKLDERQGRQPSLRNDSLDSRRNTSPLTRIRNVTEQPLTL